MKNVAKKNIQLQSASQRKRRSKDIRGNATTRRECNSVLLLFLLQGIRIKDIIIFFIKVSSSDKNYKHTLPYTTAYMYVCMYTSELILSPTSFAPFPHQHPHPEHIYSAVAVNIFHIINTFSVDITNNNFSLSHASVPPRIFGMSDTPTRRVVPKVHPFPAWIFVFMPLLAQIRIPQHKALAFSGSKPSRVYFHAFHCVWLDIS